MLKLSLVGLDAETNDLVRQLVLGDEGLGLVVHADTDEAEHCCFDNVLGEDGVC